ncbi:hypothetical protein [Neobacillus sp. PS3-40]|uniref:hypothetical protein n=1 Tax=Neobacillus sp. PS3-40 TaxID=3070679 RepID=UPI0027DEAC0F|nr:hypothetical protein [Neobacillus sp. PS3-40]WML44499.1 hypothetical protein RCG20_00860 [Neobacillus sp. PS3-40]
MKKELILIFTAILFVSLTAISGVYAFEGKKAKIITISKEEMDITGDGLKDTIYLKAVPYQDKHSYLKKIFIKIIASNNKTYRISLDSGIHPYIQFADLNHDKVNDLFVNIPTGGSEGISTNYIYSLRNFTLTNVTVPEPLEIDSSFENRYKAKIKIEQTNKEYLFNLKDRKKYYEKLGVFYKGKLNEPTELKVNSFSDMKPILLKGEEKGLTGIQRITGAANADIIAYVESSWKYVNGQWKLVKTEVLQDVEIEK